MLPSALVNTIVELPVKSVMNDKMVIRSINYTVISKLAFIIEYNENAMKIFTPTPLYFSHITFNPDKNAIAIRFTIT